MYKCQKCKEVRFSSDGECRCKLYTLTDQDGEDHKLYAKGEKDAALKYAVKSNTENGNYLIENPLVVEVNGTKYEINAEPDIYYSAHEV